jgi:hypothetical protein
VGNCKGKKVKCYGCRQVKNASPVKSEFATGGRKQSQPELEPKAQPPKRKILSKHLLKSWKNGMRW